MERTAQASLRSLGLLLAGVAAWGGIVAFVGPTFDFVLTGTTEAWVWNETQATLHFAPAFAGVVGGLLLLVGVTRTMQRLGGVLALASGFWFVMGPSLEPLWRSGAGGVVSGGASQSETMRALEMIGYHYGTGTVIAALAAFALGLLALVPAVEAAATRAPRWRGPRVLPRHIPHA